MTNLLQETIYYLKEHDLTENDVIWVGSQDLHFSFKHFATIADIEYDSGYGAPQVATDLLVVGEDWWLERHEYDGSEWWEFKQIPTRPNVYKKVDRVVGGMWDSLIDINEKEDECYEF